MARFSSKHITLILVALVAIGVIVFTLLPKASDTLPEVQVPVEETPVVTTPAEPHTHTTIGMSVEGRPIEAFTFGTGERDLLFVGGMHGGYEWNTVVLAYAFINHFTQSPESVPEDVTVHIIPSLNPDGVFAVTGIEGPFTQADVAGIGSTRPGRFNANTVDLNRNFDCKWLPESTWGATVVSAGTAPFSEPETQVLRDYVQTHSPTAVTLWHSQGNAVYASECEDGILPETLTAMNTYANASGYTAFESYDAYPITGDAEGWLASIGVPAITVELSTHGTIEWEMNLRGVTALLEHLSK